MAFFLLVFIKHTLALRLTDTLDDDLLGGLSGHPTKLFVGREWELDRITDLSILFELLGFLKEHIALHVVARQTVFIHYFFMPYPMTKLGDIAQKMGIFDGNFDAYIRIGAETNTRRLTNADPNKMQLVQTALRPSLNKRMERSAEGTYNWCVTLFPTDAYAMDSDMSLADFRISWRLVALACAMAVSLPLVVR